jgi:hypothetical protein
MAAMIIGSSPDIDIGPYAVDRFDGYVDFPIDVTRRVP